MLAQVPDIRIVGWTIGDGIEGNGDGGLHPGETAYLTIYLSNQGTEPARDVIGQLSEVVDHPDVQILTKQDAWGLLPATGEPKFDPWPPFLIQVQGTRPCGWEIPLRLEIDTSNGYQVTREFTIEMVDPRVTDLATGGGRPFYFGADPSDNLGHSVASGDLDGNGHEDLIMGVPYADSVGNLRGNAGEVVFSLGSTSVDADLAVPPSGVRFVYGEDPDDLLGYDVASGDLDGDGFDDLVLGALSGDGPSDGRSMAGEVVIVYMGESFADIDLASPPAFVSILYGADPNDQLGESVATGDLDGDGFDDLILGAFAGDGPGGTKESAGEVVIVYGDPARLAGTIDLASPPSGVSIVYGAAASDRLGISVTTGDLDGDGRDEAILGAMGADGPNGMRVLAGQVVVLWGDETRLPPSVDLASPPAGVLVVHGADSEDNLGLALATGDLDGDGFDDLAVGGYAKGPADDRLSAGEVAVIYGSPTRPAGPYIDLAAPPQGVFFIYGAEAGDFLGVSVAAGDLDGDGFDDLVAGGRNADGPANGRTGAGEAVVVYGSASRWGDIDLASPPASVIFFHGADTVDHLGMSLELGDLDGDGFEDLFLGAVQADGFDNSRADSGEVAIIPGAQRHNYRFDPDAYAFIDASIGTDLGLACDDCGATIPIGFDFDYFGQRYDTLTVSSNGYLTFDGPENRLPLYCPPRATGPNNLIAVWWDDWDLSAGGAIYSLLEGTAPNRRLTVEWAAVPAFGGPGDATFEVTLFESSDQILVQYQDTVVGGGHDAGNTGIIGLENSTGTTGVTALCFSPDLSDSLAARFRRYAGPTVVFSDDVEGGPGGWTATGLWHEVSYPTCFPSSRSGSTSWYYGQDLSCDYDTGAANTGNLTSPVIPSLPQDAALSFWFRRDVEGFGVDPNVDQSFVEVQADGGGFNDIRQLTEQSIDAWRFTDDVYPPVPNDDLFTPLDLSPFVGQDVELRFRFDTVDAIENLYLGWMIDDITIRACPVYGAVGAAEARATAQPPAICETDPGQVDALGSYCAACGVPLTYQWKKDGVPIGGATDVRYDIPAGHAPGAFDYTVEIGCPTTPGCVDESDPASVDVVAAPVAVGPTLMVTLAGGADLQFNWTDVTGASDYVLYSSTDPSVTFTNVVGSTVTGSVGLTVPASGPPLVYYLVAGRNPVCGVGPQR